MVLKSEYKSIFKRSFKNIKELNNFEFEKEDELFSLIDQLAETLFECQYNDEECPAKRIYQNYQIKKDLEKERIKALGLKFRVVGTFY